MTHVLCKLNEIAEGEARAFGPFDRARTKAFVVRRGGRIHAYWDSCPHYGDTPMAWRTNAYLNAAGDRIVCASHRAEFEIDTGRCLLGAALGKALTPAPVEATASGELVLKA